MDNEMLDFWAFQYAEAVKKRFIDYPTLEVSLVFTNQIKLLNRVRKILQVKEPVFLIKSKPGPRVKIKWRIEFYKSNPYL